MAKEQTDPTKGQDQEIVLTPEVQKFFNKRIGEARVKAREKAQADAVADAAKAKDEAEKAKLMADAEWQALSAKHEAEAQRLAPFEQEALAYRELTKTMLTDRVKALGDKAKVAVAALPEAMTDLQKLTWLNQNEGLFKVAGEAVATGGSPGRRQKPASKGDEKPIPPSKFPIRL